MARVTHKALPPATHEKAVVIILDALGREDVDYFAPRIEAKPDDWWAEDGWHFGGGMYARNLLRQTGLTEKSIGIDNWDDYYIPVFEDAVKRAKERMANA